MKVVVTGGTGLIGSHVVEQLLAAGITDVTITSRNPELHESASVRAVQAFAGDPLSLGAAMVGADVVVHAIQFPNHPVENPRRGRTYLEVDGQGTVAAVAAARAAKVRRFVYLSGAGAGEGRPQPWFRAKDMAEAAIRESGMEYAILRPSWIYGPGDRSMSRFIALTRFLPFFPQIGDGTTPVYPIAVDDVARAVAFCVRRDDAKATVLALAGPQRLSMDEVVRTVQKVLGSWRRPIIHQPIALMKLLTWPLTFLAAAPMSPSAVEFVTTSVDMDPKPAQEYFGFPFRTLEEGLRQYLR